MKDYFEHIDDYMERKLSPDEHALFEKEVENNSSLKEAVSNYHDGKKLSEGLLEVDMMETLNKLKENETVLKPKPSFEWKWLIIIGLLLAIFAIGLSIGKNLNNDLDKNEILASYIKPVDTDATKSIDTIGMNAFEKGKYFFALNRFDNSEEWFKMSIDKEKNEKSLSISQYWLGAAHLEQWEIAEAKKAWAISDEKAAKENLTLLSK